MSINRIGFASFIPPVAGYTPPVSADTGAFSDIMRSISAGNPTKEEIRTFASYLQMRMNESLMRAMGGGNILSPLTFYGRPPLAESTASGTPEPGADQTSSCPEIVERAANTYDMDPALISAVIKAESGGNPRATSPKGAMGLMQLMPGTAKELGVTDPYDPKQNIMAGTKYLKTLLDRYQGNRDLALAAYNWGPGNLEKSHRSMPRETVAYVARIKKFMGVQA